MAEHIVKGELQDSLPPFKASRAVSSSMCSSAKSASFPRSFPRTAPGHFKPQLVLYACIKMR
jgi:hypothetical protein